MGLLLTIGLAVTVGVWSSRYMISRGSPLSTDMYGPWQHWRDIGRESADPYTKAHIATTGKLRISSASAGIFEARTNSQGARLHSSCNYVVEGANMRGLWWSLAVFDSRGRLIGNDADRYEFTADTIAPNPNGSFVVTLGRDARPGNWLPTSGAGRLVLVLDRARSGDGPFRRTSARSATSICPSSSARDAHEVAAALRLPAARDLPAGCGDRASHRDVPRRQRCARIGLLAPCALLAAEQDGDRGPVAPQSSAAAVPCARRAIMRSACSIRPIRRCAFVRCFPISAGRSAFMRPTDRIFISLPPPPSGRRRSILSIVPADDRFLGLPQAIALPGVTPQAHRCAAVDRGGKRTYRRSRPRQGRSLSRRRAGRCSPRRPAPRAGREESLVVA